MKSNLKNAEFYDELVEALHDLVKFAPSGNTARRIAALTSLPYSTLMNGLSRTESNTGCRLHLDSLEAIVSAAGGEGFIARYFSVKAGGVFIELPAVSGVDVTDRAAMQAVREFGELMASYAEALEDGTITASERRRILTEAYDAQRAIAYWMAALDQ